MSSALTTQLKPQYGATRALVCPPSEQILAFAHAQLENADWILALISLLDKVLLEQKCELSAYERAIMQDDLHLRVLNIPEGIRLVDPNGGILDASTLLYLRDQILIAAEKRSQHLYRCPNLSPNSKALKQVLAQAGDKDLSDEYAAVLREAFLYHHQGQLYSLRGTRLKHRSQSQRWVWKFLHG